MELQPGSHFRTLGKGKGSSKGEFNSDSIQIPGVLFKKRGGFNGWEGGWNFPGLFQHPKSAELTQICFFLAPKRADLGFCGHFRCEQHLAPQWSSS